jgi:hypothetical protein
MTEESEQLLRIIIQITNKCVSEDGMSLPLNVFVISKNASVFALRFLNLEGDAEEILEVTDLNMEFPLHVLTIDANGVGQHDTLEAEMQH